MQTFWNHIVPRIAWLYLHCVGKTSRVLWVSRHQRTVLEERSDPVIYAFWHGRQFFFPYVYRNEPASVLVSRSKDGEIIARVMRLFGLGAVRGSSSRGGVRALVELKRVLESGVTVGVTPDGPRGPQRTVASGILYLAQKTGKPILPVTYSAKRKMIFHGWDDYWVPFPFNSIVVRYGHPIFISESDDLQKKSEELRRELDRITSESDHQAQSQKESSQVWESFIYFIYSFFLLLFSPLLLLGVFLKFPSNFFSDFRSSFSARLGFSIENWTPGKRRPLWVHAASLGECRAAFPLVRAIKKEYPDQPIIYSVTTRPGLEEAKRLQCGDFITYAPLDIPWILEKFFKRLRPKMFLLLESEIWPNWVRQAHKRGIPIGIVNGRISQKSFRRYLQFRSLATMVMQKIDFVSAREPMDKERFISLGVKKERTVVAGNLKYDYCPPEWKAGAGSQEPFHLSHEGICVWAAGSLREGEEKYILEVFSSLRKDSPDLKLILAPRHLGQVSDTLRISESLGMKSILKTIWIQNPSAPWDLMVWDSLGDLWLAYRECHFAFVGGSLVPKGGQNPIEPAWFAKPVLFGKSMENFSEPARILLESGGGIQVENPQDLKAKIEELLKNRDRIGPIGKSAKEAVQKFSGKKKKKTLEIIKGYL
ncbi:MAG: DUF374 domain-containing protein [Elusimicrobia bacterium]|nr:DUF374 domain-containing protein [Elusimicrobiota bacterium]